MRQPPASNDWHLESGKAGLGLVFLVPASAWFTLSVLSLIPQIFEGLLWPSTAPGAGVAGERKNPCPQELVCWWRSVRRWQMLWRTVKWAGWEDEAGSGSHEGLTEEVAFKERLEDGEGVNL